MTGLSPFFPLIAFLRTGSASRPPLAYFRTLALANRGYRPFNRSPRLYFLWGQRPPNTLQLCPALFPGADALSSAHRGAIFYGAVLARAVAALPIFMISSRCGSVIPSSARNLLITAWLAHTTPLKLNAHAQAALVLLFYLASL